MEIVKKIQTYIYALEEKRFYQYIIGFVVVILLALSGIIFQYFRKVGHLKAEISLINEEREEARSILEKAHLVKREQKEIDAILAKEENFKIAGYFEDLLARIGLANKKTSQEINTAIKEGQYQESILQAKFTNMTMKDLTELLQEIESNKRIFTKELNITISLKQAGTIDVALIIATLEPKPKEAKEITE